MASLLNELRLNLETAKEVGNVEWQERLEKRIKAEERAEAVEEEVPEESPELGDFTVKELRAIANDQGIEGAATMKKAELVKALEA